MTKERFEYYARQQGIREGIAQGITQGIAQGITQGFAQGITQGIQQQKAEDERLLKKTIAQVTAQKTRKMLCKHWKLKNFRKKLLC